MAGNVLTAKIRVDDEGVASAFNNTATAATKTKVALGSTDQIVQNIIKDSSSLSNALNTLSKRGLLSINILENSINDFRQAMKQATDVNDIKKYGDAITALTVKQKELTAAGLGTSGVSNSLTKSFTGLRQLANVLPGIGVAGLFNLAFEGVSKVIDAITASLGPANNALAEFNEGFAEIASKSISNLELLKAKLNDSNTTQSQRLELVKDYNREADKQNQLDLTQAGNLDLINSKINQQIELLKQRAAVRAAEAVVSKAFEKLFNAQLDLQLSFPNLQENKDQIISQAQSFIKSVNDKLKITPTFDTKELLALADLPIKQLQDLAKQGGKFQIFSDPTAVTTLKRFNDELKNSVSLTKNLGQAGVLEGLQGTIAGAQKNVDDILSLFGRILSVEGFSEQTKDKVEKVFEAFKVAFVKGSKDVVELLELNPHKLALPFILALDQDKLGLQFSNVKAELNEKLHQFDFRPSAIPVTVQFQITADASFVKPLNDDIKKQFADARGALFNLSNVDLSKVFKTDAVNTGLEQTFKNLKGIDGELQDIGNRGDFTKFAQQIQHAAELMTSILQPAFQKFFDGLVQGQIKIKNFLDGMLDAIKQVISKLLTAAAIAAIIAGLTGGSFTSIFSSLIGFKEKGGEVNKGNKYVVNERGTEMFKPSGGKPMLIAGGPQFFTPPVSGKIITHLETEKILKAMSVKKMNTTGFKNTISGYRQGGGSVVAGNTYVVNEAGREIFIPNTGQAINVAQPSANIRTGSFTINVGGQIEISGNKLLAVLANTGRSQQRTT